MKRVLLAGVALALTGCAVVPVDAFEPDIVPGPTVTVTEAPEPGPTVTKTVPGPEVTVTVSPPTQAQGNPNSVGIQLLEEVWTEQSASDRAEICSGITALGWSRAYEAFMAGGDYNAPVTEGDFRAFFTKVCAETA